MQEDGGESRGVALSQHPFQLGEQGRGVKDAIQKLARQGDDGGVDDGGDQGAKPDAVEALIADGRPIEGGGVPEQRECQNQRKRQKGKVKRPFHAPDPQGEAVCHLCNEELVNLKGKIGAEKAGNAQGGNGVSQDQHDPAKPNRIEADTAEDQEKEIEGIAVKHSHRKRQKIPQVKAADHKAEQKEQNPLDEIFGHSHAQNAPKGSNRLPDHEGGRRDHGNAKIGFGANGNAQCHE